MYKIEPPNARGQMSGTLYGRVRYVSGEYRGVDEQRLFNIGPRTDHMAELCGRLVHVPEHLRCNARSHVIIHVIDGPIATMRACHVRRHQ